jgi:hypothetical protein
MNNSISLFDLIDNYLAYPGLILSILFFILNIIMNLVFIVSFFYYLFKKNFHQKIIMSLLIFETTTNIIVYIIYIVQFSLEIPLLLNKATRAMFILSSIIFQLTCETGLSFLFCYLAFIYSKTLKDLNLIRKCTFIISITILIVLCSILVLVLIFDIIVITISIILLGVLNNLDVNIVMTIYGMITIPFFVSVISSVSFCGILVIIYSIRLVWFIFSLSKKIEDKSSKFKNFLSLFKIVFLVCSINFFYTFHIEGLIAELVYVIFGHIFWFVAFFIYMVDTFIITILFFISFGPCKFFKFF